MVKEPQHKLPASRSGESVELVRGFLPVTSTPPAQLYRRPTTQVPDGRRLDAFGQLRILAIRGRFGEATRTRGLIQTQ